MDAPNKRSRSEAFSEAYVTEELQTLLEHDDPVFEHLQLYEKGSGVRASPLPLTCLRHLSRAKTLENNSPARIFNARANAANFVAVPALPGCESQACC